MGTVVACPECGHSLAHAEDCQLGAAIARRQLAIAQRATRMLHGVRERIVQQTPAGASADHPPAPLLVKEIMIAVSTELDGMAVFLVQEIQKARKAELLKPPELPS